MKLAKKITSMILSMFLLVALIPSSVYAASGRISFTDLTTEAGVEFEIKVAVTSESDDIGSVNISLNYDSEMMQFVSADGVTNDGSTLTYSVEGSGTSVETVITFLALKEGSATITISEQTVATSDGTTIDMTEGSSAITISGGTEVEASETVTNTSASGISDVTVGDVTYSISNDFSESVIPVGYTATTYEYDGSTFNGVVGDTSGIVLAYLVDGEGTGQFFMYEASSSTFSPYVQITVSDATYIVFLTTGLEETLPDEFVETVLTVNGFEFPTWEDTENSGYYLIHAINSNGEDSIYRYDSQEQTYQRYYVTESSTTSDTDSEDVASAMADYTQWMMIGVGSVVILLLIFIVVLTVKLRNRNLELDDLYDEIELGSKPQSVESKGQTARKVTDKKIEDKCTSGGKASNGKPPVKKVTDKKAPVKKAPVKKAPEKITEDNSKRVSQKSKKSRDEFDEFDELMMDEHESKYDEYDDEFDKFDKFDEFDEYDDFEDDFEAFVSNEVKEVEPRKSIKRVAANRKKTSTLEDEIDFIDL